MFSPFSNSTTTSNSQELLYRLGCSSSGLGGAWGSLPLTAAAAAHHVRPDTARRNMSPKSTGDSPHSATTTRPFPVPSRDNFAIDVPTPSLSATNGNGLKSPLKSPTALKTQRQASFTREGILGSAQKARNMSQSSDNRQDSLGMLKDGSDECTNPLKRRNTDASVDYPRRRATIAVC